VAANSRRKNRSFPRMGMRQPEGMEREQALKRPLKRSILRRGLRVRGFGGECRKRNVAITKPLAIVFPDGWIAH